MGMGGGGCGEGVSRPAKTTQARSSLKAFSLGYRGQFREGMNLLSGA